DHVHRAGLLPPPADGEAVRRSGTVVVTPEVREAGGVRGLVDGRAGQAVGPHHACAVEPHMRFARMPREGEVPVHLAVPRHGAAGAQVEPDLIAIAGAHAHLGLILAMRHGARGHGQFLGQTAGEHEAHHYGQREAGAVHHRCLPSSCSTSRTKAMRPVIIGTERVPATPCAPVTVVARSCTSNRFLQPAVMVMRSFTDLVTDASATWQPASVLRPTLPSSM